jgi:hypothetical protein
MVQVLKTKKITISVFRKIIEVVDVAFARERISTLKLSRPDCGFGERIRMGCQVDWRKRKAGCSQAVAESARGEPLPIPRRVASLVAEYVTCVIQDDVENDPNSQLVSIPYELPETLARAEVGSTSRKC